MFYVQRPLEEPVKKEQSHGASLTEPAGSCRRACHKISDTQQKINYLNGMKMLVVLACYSSTLLSKSTNFIIRILYILKMCLLRAPFWALNRQNRGVNCVY